VIQAEIEKSTKYRWWPYHPDDQVAADIAKDNPDLVFELGGSPAMNKLEVRPIAPRGPAPFPGMAIRATAGLMTREAHPRCSSG